MFLILASEEMKFYSKLLFHLSPHIETVASCHTFTEVNIPSGGFILERQFLNRYILVF